MHVTLTEPTWGNMCSPSVDGVWLEHCVEACEEGGWALCAKQHDGGGAVFTPEGLPVLVLRRGVIVLVTGDIPEWVVDQAQVFTYRATPHAPCPLPVRGDAVILAEEVSA
jgi:hypothetical protein